MGPIYRSLANYESLIYVALAIWGLFVLRTLFRQWGEWRDAVFSLEREFALRRLGRTLAVAILILGLVSAQFFIATFVVPALPASDLAVTPTLDLLASPVGSLSPAESTQAIIAPLTPVAQNGMSGCVPEQIMITDPTPGAVVQGTVDILGTANVQNFAFFKYEIAPLGTENWSTVSASREPKTDTSLGSWNTSLTTNGEYFLRLVVTTNTGEALEPCIIAVRVLNE